MADVRPLRGLRYSPAAGDLGELLCPPYDLITASMQQALYQRSAHNAIRLEMPESRPTDTPERNRYTRAAATLQRWARDGVLLRERRPVLYLLRQGFAHRGRPMERLALIAAVRLVEFERGVVLPHEHTSEAPKRDRLQLMKACRANISPVMALYRDPQRAVAREVRRALRGAPVASAHVGDERYDLWALEDPGQQAAVRRALASQPLYLADGHHRYETALAYRDLMRRQAGEAATGEEAWNFLLMALVDMDDPGLLVLPYHRLVGGLAPHRFTRVRDQLTTLFAVDPLPGDQRNGWLQGLLDAVAERGRQAQVLGLLGPDGEGPYLLTLRPGRDLSRWGPMARFEAWLLEELALRPVLGDALGEHLAYVHDAEEAAQRVARGAAQMAFFLKPLPLDLFEEIVRRGQRLPPKSTYFWPKLPTGLVFNTLEGDL